jgi:hypothetical protein
MRWIGSTGQVSSRVHDPLLVRALCIGGAVCWHTVDGPVVCGWCSKQECCSGDPCHANCNHAVVCNLWHTHVVVVAVTDTCTAPDAFPKTHTRARTRGANVLSYGYAAHCALSLHSSFLPCVQGVLVLEYSCVVNDSTL